MLILFLFITVTDAQFIGYLGLSWRIPGRCHEGDFDCGGGQCVPIDKYHDGRPDCADGSDEWCFFGHVPCGSYCVGLQHSFGCLTNTKCDGSSKQAEWCNISKQKLCLEKQSFPCKGYGECVKWNWLLDGKKDCIDGSDEDAVYVRILEGPKRCFYNRTGQVQPAPVKYKSLPAPPAVPAVQPIAPCIQCPTNPIRPAVNPHNALPFAKQTTLSTSPSFATLLRINATSGPTIFENKHTTSRSKSSLKEVQIHTILPKDQLGVFFPTEVPKTENKEERKDDLSSVTPNSNENEVSDVKIQPVATEKESSDNHGEFFPIHTHVDLAGENANLLTTHIKTSVTGDHSDNQFAQIRPILSEENTHSTAHELVKSSTLPTPYKVVVTEPAKSTTIGNDFYIPALRPITGTTVTANPLKPIVPVPFPFSKPTQSYIWPSNGFGGQELIPIRPGIMVPTSSSTGKTSMTTQTENIHTVTANIILQSTTKEVPKSTPSPSNSSIQYPTRTSTLISQTTTISIEDTVSTENPISSKVNKCITKLSEYAETQFPNPNCECETGQMLVNGVCKDTNVTLLQVSFGQVCGRSEISDTLKSSLAISMVQDARVSSACVRKIDGGLFLNLRCDECDLEMFQELQRKGVGSSVELKLTALNNTICSDSSLNHCHAYARCTVISSGLSYFCQCKPGTEDVSHKTGRICEGFPDEDSCVVLFGICLIVWLIFLLGLMFILPLLGFLVHKLYKARRENRVHPITQSKRNTTEKGTTRGSSRASSNRASTKGTNVTMIWDQALKNNAQKNTAMAQSFLLNEFSRSSSKRVSKTPNMSRVLEEDSSTHEADSIEGSSKKTLDQTTVTLKDETALPSEIKSAAPEPINDEKNANEKGETIAEPKAEQITPSASSVSVTTPSQENEKGFDVPKLNSSMNGSESAASLTNTVPPPTIPTPTPVPLANANQEIGNRSPVQVPTIWQSYKGTGFKAEDIDRQDSSNSLDDLIAARFSQNSTKPSEVEDSVSRIKNPSPELQLAAEVTEREPEPVSEKQTEMKESVAMSTNSEESQIRESKLAEMLGVTLPNSEDYTDSTIKDKNDAQALADMAEKNIALPLENDLDSSTANTKDVTSSLLLEENLLEQGLPQPDTPVPLDVPLSIVTEEKAEERPETIEQQKFTPGRNKFVPKNKPRKTQRIEPGRLLKGTKGREDSSDDSDAEVVLLNRIAKLKNDERAFRDRKRRYRKPERQLSSISEKSAEVAASAALEDYSISAPNTTRSLADWHGFVPRKQRILNKDRGSGFTAEPIISSPEIPDVSSTRSTERWNEIHHQQNEPTKEWRHNNGKQRHVSSSTGDLSTEPPQNSRRPIYTSHSTREPVKQKARTSRNNGHHALISRKIATRRHEVRTSQSVRNLTGESSKSKELRSCRDKSRSMVDLRGRPRWDSSPFKDGEPRNDFLPPISKTYSATNMSVAHKRSGSHASIGVRSGSSLEHSPVFNPDDFNKPPKEDLWWGPPLR